MLGCTYGTMFQTTVAGGSYQEGLTVHLQGVPPGLYITESEIYSALLTRKPGQSELASPRREPDVPIIYSGVNAADTMPGFSNKGYTNGTPMVILIPNLDRQFEHIEQYQSTNRTPRPGHASYASYIKYGEWDDSIGAGFFSGRYTSTIVAAGAVARHILKQHGIDVFAYVKEAAGVRASDVPINAARVQVDKFREVRRDYDPIYNWLFTEGRFTNDMRFLHKARCSPMGTSSRSSPTRVSWTRKPSEEHGSPDLNCPDVMPPLTMADPRNPGRRRFQRRAGGGDRDGLPVAWANPSPQVGRELGRSGARHNQLLNGADTPSRTCVVEDNDRFAPRTAWSILSPTTRAV